MIGISLTKEERLNKGRKRAFNEDPLNAKGESANEILKTYVDKNWKVVEDTPTYYLIFKNTKNFFVGLLICWIPGMSEAYYKSCEKYKWIDKK